VSTVQQTPNLQAGSNRQTGFAQTQSRSWTLPGGTQQTQSGSTSVVYTVDEAGAITGDGLRSFAMDATGRLAAVRQGDLQSTYLHNTLGQRRLGKGYKFYSASAPSTGSSAPWAR